VNRKFSLSGGCCFYHRITYKVKLVGLTQNWVIDEQAKSQ